MRNNCFRDFTEMINIVESGLSGEGWQYQENGDDQDKDGGLFPFLCDLTITESCGKGKEDSGDDQKTPGKLEKIRNVVSKR